MSKSAALALVGESGSGKSTIGRTIQQLQPAMAGSIAFSGKPFSAMSAAQRFNLRHGVTFHDGEPFNAAAVKFTFDRLLGEQGANGPQRSNYTTIDSVEMIDDYTVDMKLNAPDPVLLTKLAGYGGMIVPPRYIQEQGEEHFNLNPFGTDPLGRDVLARVAAGGKISLLVGFTSVAGSLVFGVVMGLIAGYYRGFWDMLLMRFADLQLAMPFILLAITFIAIVGGSLTNTIILLIVSQWVQYARLVRGSVLTLREREFILAARAIGVRDWRIIVQHLLPNLIGPVIVLMTLNVANNILLESSLTFLGLGVDPTVPSWGGMLADGRTYLQTAWWVSVFPGLAILLTVLGLNLLGDWLRDSLDPSGRASRSPR